MFNWNYFLARLRAYPSFYHKFLPPCPRERIEAVESEFGKFPQLLQEMLAHFNGAKLFIASGPLLNFFRISAIPAPPPFDWATDWCIETYTAAWRGAGSDRHGDWAFAMTNYGGLILLDADTTVKEWDTGESRWLRKNLPFEQWIEKIISEGEQIMANE